MIFRLRVSPLAFVLIAGACGVAHGQWDIEDSHTTADLRGIDSVGGGVAWASGTKGTVLRTEDGGHTWQTCAVPPGAEHLDFRGIQAFDANTAIVMSSGKGDLSRLYKTTDACATWKLAFRNPYAPDGFFDAIVFLDRRHGVVLSDPGPVNFTPSAENPGDFHLRVTADGGTTWGPVSAPDIPRRGNGLHPLEGEAAFAASNTSVAVQDGWLWFATSAGRVAARRLFAASRPPQLLFESTSCAGASDPISHECGQPWTDFHNAVAPINHSTESAGIFSIHFRTPAIGVVVGGDYLKPDDSPGTAAYSDDGGEHWRAAQNPPHGYRSAVAYDAGSRIWITVGTNGTDISTDEGRSWRAVDPDSTLHEPLDDGRNWNALSLPFVVGPRGRIGKLNHHAIEGVLATAPRTLIGGIGSSTRRSQDLPRQDRTDMQGSLLLTSARELPAGSQAQPALPQSAPTVSLAPLSAPPNVLFEVASVKPTAPEQRVQNALLTYPGGRMVALGANLRYLLMEAYRLPPAQIVGGPAWIDRTRFDIEARPPAEVASRYTAPRGPKDPPPDELRAMLQNLLIERFRLKVHLRQDRAQAYALVRTSGPLRLSPPSDPKGFPWAGAIGGGLPDGEGLRGTNDSMHDLAFRISQWLSAPVVDETELPGSYDFQVSLGPREADARLDTDDVYTSIFEALRQLGLKLEKRVGGVQTLVIDSASMPLED